MSFVDELAVLSDDFVRGLGADTGLVIRRRVPGAYNPTTQAHAADGTETYTLTRYVRSAARQTVGSRGGLMVRMEEFSFSFTTADLVAAGWPADNSKPFDENSTIVVDSKVYPVVSVERECGEGLIKLAVRTDLGVQT